jgi:hypothetical protein
MGGGELDETKERIKGIQTLVEHIDSYHNKKHESTLNVLLTVAVLMGLAMCIGFKRQHDYFQGKVARLEALIAEVDYATFETVSNLGTDLEQRINAVAKAHNDASPRVHDIDHRLGWVEEELHRFNTRMNALTASLSRTYMPHNATFHAELIDTVAYVQHQRQRQAAFNATVRELDQLTERLVLDLNETLAMWNTEPVIVQQVLNQTQTNTTTTTRKDYALDDFIDHVDRVLPPSVKIIGFVAVCYVCMATIELILKLAFSGLFVCFNVVASCFNYLFAPLPPEEQDKLILADIQARLAKLHNTHKWELRRVRDAAEEAKRHPLDYGSL